jgi:hypothetical protein
MSEPAAVKKVEARTAFADVVRKRFLAARTQIVEQVIERNETDAEIDLVSSL